MAEPTLGQVFEVVKSNNEKIKSIEEKVNKVGDTVDMTLDGLYGPLNDREKGVIPKHDKRIQTLEEKDKHRGWLTKTVFGTIITFILTAILIAIKGNLF
jgi:hypothetical protein